MEEIDERREAAIAAKFRPDLNPNSNIKQSQLAKFQELHRRRLQLKSKSKSKSKSKMKKTLKEKCSDDEEGISQVVDVEDFPLHQNDVQKRTESKKRRQKLHWGLDTKERWERKSNM